MDGGLAGFGIHLLLERPCAARWVVPGPMVSLGKRSSPVGRRSLIGSDARWGPRRFPPDGRSLVERAGAGHQLLWGPAP